MDRRVIHFDVDLILGAPSFQRGLVMSHFTQKRSSYSELSFTVRQGGPLGYPSRSIGGASCIHHLLCVRKGAS